MKKILCTLVFAMFGSLITDVQGKSLVEEAQNHRKKAQEVYKELVSYVGYKKGNTYLGEGLRALGVPKEEAPLVYILKKLVNKPGFKMDYEKQSKDWLKGHNVFMVRIKSYLQLWVDAFRGSVENK